MNKCKWNIGVLKGKPILCNKEIRLGYDYCYGHHRQDLKRKEKQENI